MRNAERLIGQQFRNYQFIDYLGYKTMAHTYRARQEGTPRSVVVQLLPAQLARSGRFVQAFNYQFGQLKTAHHPTINRIIEFGVDKSFPYIISEYVKGPTLYGVLETMRKKLDR